MAAVVPPISRIPDVLRGFTRFSVDGNVNLLASFTVVQSRGLQVDIDFGFADIPRDGSDETHSS
jgi:hypothetical protein